MYQQYKHRLQDKMETFSAQQLTFYVNGRKVSVDQPDPKITLLQYLRRTLCLPGTKEGCGQGACGSCTVMISKWDQNLQKIRHISANACLVYICSLHGTSVTTVEGVGSSKNGLHPIQESLVQSHGMQCGFCTPGMVMTMYTLLRNNPGATPEQMERALEGNLCRCTGYRPIVEAFRAGKENFHKEKKTCPCGFENCKERGQNDSSAADVKVNQKIEDVQKDASQDFIFPPYLITNHQEFCKDIVFEAAEIKWYRPVSLNTLLALRSKYPDALFIMGGNSDGYKIKTNTMKSNVVICGSNVKELTDISMDKKNDQLRVGAGVTMGQLEEYINILLTDKKVTNTRSLRAALRVIRWLGIDQVRNTATIGGHIMSGKSNHDLYTFLMAAGSTLEFHGNKGSPIVKKLDNDFGNQCTDGEFASLTLLTIILPLGSKNKYYVGFKQPKRRGYDYGVVTAALYVKYECKIKSLRLCVGGIKKHPFLANESAKAVIGKKWTKEVVSVMCEKLCQELQPMVHENDTYRLTATCGLLLKFFLEIDNEIKGSPIVHLSSWQEQTVSSMQLYQTPTEDGTHIVWQPLPNVLSNYIVSGEAQFVDDIPCYTNELFAALVTSTRAHARVVSIDASEALKQGGVVGIVDHKDLHKNLFGRFFPESRIFAENEVLFYGNIILAVLGTSREIAKAAAKLVKIVYEDLDAVLTMEDAIKKGSLYEQFGAHMKKGDVQKAETDAEFTISGECRTGVQEHLYLETHQALVVPNKEQQEFVVYSSTQGPSEVQAEVAEALGVDRNRIITKTKRAGGAFGGKVFDAFLIAAVAAAGANKANCPVRCIMDRTTDIRSSGKRHESMTKFKVSFNKSGKITGLELKSYINAGYILDLSGFVGFAMTVHGPGAYNIENLKIDVELCKTNTTSSTAMRGFGAPQAVYIMENVITAVADHLKISRLEIQKANLLKTNDVTWYNCHITDDNLERCKNQLLELSEYDRRLKETEEFNRKNKALKRGIATMPVSYPIGYPPLFMNQGGALVLIYTDGSVLLATGGVEMGQGINTKIIQVACSVLGVPMDKVIISETSTGTVPNTVESGGSQAGDLNAGAAYEACKIINERLQPYKSANPEGQWLDWVKAAHFDRINLSASAVYKTPIQGFDIPTSKGQFANYLTNGFVCTEVELDNMTGEHKVNRVDIVMDVGKSWNPAIDIGQIEGGFVQGYGMMTMEELKLTKDGRVEASGPIDYKIPCVRNIPRQFNVKLLQDTGHVNTVYSAKGIGEPPLLLAVSAYQALIMAVKAARSDLGITTPPNIQCPLTTEKILLACNENFTKRVDAVLNGL